MKPKNLSKRLVLNKETVANLWKKEMKEAVGGIDDSGHISCITSPCIYTQQPTCPPKPWVTNEITCIC